MCLFLAFLRYGGTDDDDDCTALSLDANGTTLFVLGSFKSTSITLGSKKLNNYDTSGGGLDTFLAKLSVTAAAGRWADGRGASCAHTSRVDHPSRINGVRSPLDLYCLVTPPHGSVRVHAGTVEWAVRMGGSSDDDVGLSVAADSNSGVVVGGYFKSTYFSIITTAQLLTNSGTTSGNEDAFLAR